MPRRRPTYLRPPDPVTETDAFRRWFGNSQVVDDRGQPLVVYHGTPDARGIYLPEVSRNGLPGFQPGIWRKPTSFYASDSPRVARTYADDTRAWDYQKAEPMVIPLYLRIVNPMVIDARGVEWANTEGYVARAHQAGHDGLIIRNSLDDYHNTKHSKPSTVYVWFEPNQAKSAATATAVSMVDRQPLAWATPNDGSFDMDDPDIRSNRSYRRNASPAPVRRAILVMPFLPKWEGANPDQTLHLFYVEGGLLDELGERQEWIIVSTVPANREEKQWVSTTMLWAANPDGTDKTPPPGRRRAPDIVRNHHETMDVRDVFRRFGLAFQDRLMAVPDEPRVAPRKPWHRRLFGT